MIATTSTATVFALTTLAISMTTVIGYFLIFFGSAFLIVWSIAIFLREIVEITQK